MLKTRLIPCMLFSGMSLVKTIQFGQLRNLGNPIQTAKVYNARNVDELIFIDLLASEEGREPLYDVIREIVPECFMPLTIGGGIHTVDQVSRLLSIGADKVSLQSEAIKNPDFINQVSRTFGDQCVVVSIDAKFLDGEYRVFTRRAKENTGMTAVAWAREAEQRGAGELLLTSIDRDGTMTGFDVALIQKVTSAVSIPVIACGGAGKVQDVLDAVHAGASAVALASMFHYSGHTSNSIKQRMRQAGIPVRILP